MGPSSRDIPSIWCGDASKFLRSARTVTLKASLHTTAMVCGDQPPPHHGVHSAQHTGTSLLPGTASRQRLGHRASVFCSSMADVYEDHPTVNQERPKLWRLIEQTPWLNWLLLTKRPENILKMSPWRTSFPDNVWIGTSAGLQKRAEERVPFLLEVPAVVHFLSCEPLLGPLDLTPWLSQLQWVICGGESGTGARPFDLDWARSLRDQCQQHHAHFFFKQVGGRYHNSGGRMLDGRTWDEMPPEVAQGRRSLTLRGCWFTEGIQS